MKNKQIVFNVCFWIGTIALFVISTFVCEMHQVGTYINEHNTKYYIFTAPKLTQIIICVVCVLFFVIFGFVLGRTKQIVNAVVFITLLILLKFAIFISGIVDESFSNLLWGIYIAPISAITDSIDILNWAVYEVIFLPLFVAGIVTKKQNHKLAQRTHPHID